MSPKPTFLICAAVGLIFAVAFALAPKFFTLGAWPTAEGLALEIGVSIRYVLAAAIFQVSLLQFAASTIKGADNQKLIMLSSAIGFTIVCATILCVGLFRGDGIPVFPPIIATGVLAILCWLSWSRITLTSS